MATARRTEVLNTFFLRMHDFDKKLTLIIDSKFNEALAIAKNFSGVNNHKYQGTRLDDFFFK